MTIIALLTHSLNQVCALGLRLVAGLEVWELMQSIGCCPPPWPCLWSFLTWAILTFLNSIQIPKSKDEPGSFHRQSSVLTLTLIAPKLTICRAVGQKQNKKKKSAHEEKKLLKSTRRRKKIRESSLSLACWRSMYEWQLAQLVVASHSNPADKMAAPVAEWHGVGRACWLQRAPSPLQYTSPYLPARSGGAHIGVWCIWYQKGY